MLMNATAVQPLSSGLENPCCILIVDDEPRNLALLEGVLNDPAYRLIRAASAEEALLTLVKHDFALIILDIRMPGMSGLELARIIKERKQTAGVPIIFLTAYYSEDQHMLEGYGSGAVDYLHKPVIPVILRSKVAVFAELHRKNRACALANRTLQTEVTVRRHAEVQLYELNDQLENRVTERTQALAMSNAALTETAERYRSLFDGSLDAIVSLGADGHFEAANPAAQRLAGRSLEELKAVHFMELCPPDQRQRVETAFRAAICRQGLTIETTTLTAAGERRNLFISGAPAIIDGQVIGVSCIVRDVTDLKRREANLAFLLELQKSLVPFMSAADIMHTVTSRIAQHLHLTRCLLVGLDEAAEEATILHDHHAATVPGLAGVYHITDFHTEEERRKLAAGQPVVIDDMRQSQRPAANAERFVALGIGALASTSYVVDGQWKSVLSAQQHEPRVWMPEDMELLTELAVRIHLRLERARAEEQLRTSEEFSRTVLKSSPDCVKVLDVNGCLLMMNGPGMCLLEIEDFEALRGKPWWELWPEQSQTQLQAATEQARRGELAQFEEFCPTCKGTDKWWDVVVAPVRNSSGTVEQFIAVSRDITARKQADAALQQAHEKLQSVLSSLNDGMVVLDKNWCYTEFSEPGLRMVGMSREQLIGACAWDLFPHAKGTLFYESYHRAVESGQVVHFEEFYPEPLNKWLECHCYPSEQGLTVYFHDITPRKQAEEAQHRLQMVTASNQKLEQEIVRRQAVEDALITSQQTTSELLEKSGQMQKELRHLSRQVLQAQEEERKRISRELHDVIAQTLTGINVRLSLLQSETQASPKDLQGKIALTQRLVEQSVDTVHRFARDLRPAMLDDLGLIPALRSYLKDFTQQTGIIVNLKADAAIEALESAGRTVLYRVAQEALTNVLRHAKASLVDINLQKLTSTITLEIKDNGRGFEVNGTSCAAKTNRLGLLGMRERVEMIGGTFQMKSAPGLFTAVCVEIPQC